MNGFERVKRAMHFKSVDKAPLRNVYSRAGFYEHGDKLNDLFATLPCDVDNRKWGYFVFDGIVNKYCVCLGKLHYRG